MRHIYHILTLIICTLILTSCSKEDLDVPTTPITNTNTSKDSYYVRYEVSYGRGFSSAECSMTTEKGTFSVHLGVGGSVNETFGPVKKQFVATLRTTFHPGGMGGNQNYTLKIYAGKNQEPMSLKEVKSSNYKTSNTCTISYRIDF